MIAGEASGDLLGAHLYQALKAKESVLDCSGMGGLLMQAAGVNILVSSNDLGVVGGIEILKHFSKIRKAYKTIKKAIKQRKPKLVILIDYPGFNLRIAKFAKKTRLQSILLCQPPNLGRGVIGAFITLKNTLITWLYYFPSRKRFIKKPICP